MPHDREYAQKQKNLTTHFFGLSTKQSEFYRCLRAMPLPHDIGRRFARKLFKHAIELREGLKSRSECDFADAHIRRFAADHTRWRTACARRYSTKLIPVTCLKFSLR